MKLQRAELTQGLSIHDLLIFHLEKHQPCLLRENNYHYQELLSNAYKNSSPQASSSGIKGQHCLLLIWIHLGKILETSNMTKPSMLYQTKNSSIQLKKRKILINWINFILKSMINSKKVLKRLILIWLTTLSSKHIKVQKHIRIKLLWFIEERSRSS